MTARVFVDTNVLVYAHDSTAGSKRIVAGALLRKLWEERTGVLSPQVLQEFYVNATRKIARPIPHGEARGLLSEYASWVRTPTDAALVLHAAELESRHRLAFWDAMIVAAAARSGAETLATEDLQSGRSLEGLRIVNPFSSR